MPESDKAYIETPHKHDVLSGRGNFVNYHAGNEYFRSLVREHKVAYVACPKPQKGKYSQLIVDKIRALDPPGRFLKQDNNTKLWYDIGEKKALDKTRQALREGAPELLKEISHPEDDNYDAQNDMKQPAFFENSEKDQPLAMGQRMLAATAPQSIQYNTHTVALKGLDDCNTEAQEDVLQNQLPSEYGTIDALEPTPMNPSIVEKNRRNQFQNNNVGDAYSRSQSSSDALLECSDSQPEPGLRPGFQREVSLKFDAIFHSQSSKGSGGKGKSKSTRMESSNNFSAMSFSIGDMTDASNLSAVFEDSMRISDNSDTEKATKRKSALGEMPENMSIAGHSFAMFADDDIPNLSSSNVFDDET